MARLPADGFVSMCDAVGPGRHRHPGATDWRRAGRATHAVDVRTRGGEICRLVLKRYRAADLTIEREWRGLKVAWELDVPSPQPIALDAVGSLFGTAAIAMARLPGHPEVNRVDADAFLARTAAALARIHGTRADPRLEVTIGRQPRHIWACPSPPPRDSMLRRAHEMMEHLCATESEPVLLHGDFFSGNLLWLRGKLTGVVSSLSVGGSDQPRRTLRHLCSPKCNETARL